jgi:hypothetical protein
VHAVNIDLHIASKLLLPEKLVSGVLLRSGLRSHEVEHFSVSTVYFIIII